ncbi:hypothetical protein C0993_004518 [Termitomyces sp. T159_Od127]|nr:hypothetical protein C0993_004518 [Termitomyces sp. T159_Od127]
MVESIAFHLKKLLEVHVQFSGEGIELGTKLAKAVVEGSPLFEGFNNGEELLVIDVVVDLHEDHQAGVKGNKPELVTTRVHLQEYTSNGVDKTQVVSKGVLMISLAQLYGLVVSAPSGLPGVPSKG